MSDAGDSKAAEKDYLRRSGGGAWERAKPFSPPGTDQFEEGLDILNDFVVALRLLRPTADDRILDLGAGGGWCSDLLSRMSRRSFPVDISFDMLRISRERGSNGGLPATVGDLERLPFIDGSFTKAICVSALHHVPDMGAPIREVFRVLNEDGVVVFSEPGVGHATEPWSVAATSDFGVLEQEVHIEPTIQMCRAAGFADAYVCPISYVIPEFRLTDDDWRAWIRLPLVKRPMRAAQKLGRALLELAGAGKRGPLFEEAFAMRLVRLLQMPVRSHPFIMATKRRRQSSSSAPYRASIDARGLPEALRPSARVPLTVAVTNTGRDAWRSGNSLGGIQLGLQLLDAGARLIDRDSQRVPLPRAVPPGDTVIVHVTFAAPADPGDYVVKFDMVAEGRTWFEPTGSPALTTRIRVAH